MPNIAIYIADTKPSGITRYALNINTCLSGLGYDCQIISDTNLSRTFMPKTITLSPEKAMSGSEIIKRIIRLKKEIDKRQTDIIISNGWYHDMVALFASKLSRSKPHVVGVIHTRPQLWGISLNIFGKIKRYLIKKVYQREAVTISVSDSMASSLINSGWIKKTKTIYNPIVSDQLKALSRIRKRSYGCIKLCCIGWISPVKGIDIAINALSKVVKQVPATLTLIGDINNENYFAHIKDQIKKLELEENIKIDGPIDDPYIILDEMDILLLPSRSEALPTALVEAMALGLPVIACDCEFGPREILGDSEYGSLVPTGDFERMAVEILRIAANPDLYRRMSEKGICRALDFNFDSCAKQYDNVLKNLITKKSRLK